MNDTLSHITISHLSKQIERDLLEAVDSFIGCPLEGGTVEAISNHCTKYLEEFYGQYYDREQYVLRVDVTPSDTNKSVLTLGWRLCERPKVRSEAEGLGYSY